MTRQPAGEPTPLRPETVGLDLANLIGTAGSLVTVRPRFSFIAVVALALTACTPSASTTTARRVHHFELVDDAGRVDHLERDDRDDPPGRNRGVARRPARRDRKVDSDRRGDPWPRISDTTPR